MFRYLTLTLAFICCGSMSQAQDAIAPETVEAVKKAAVFIRVEGEGWASSGSGFVVKSDANTVLVATNDHVASVKPPITASGNKAPTITVVFDSGTKTERTYTAQIVATDPDKDLAVLRVVDVKDAPKPIPYNEPPKLVETMQVYSFGFPFGKALSQTKGFPAITVGKASISSLRDGADGELAVVQIDGNLNPGNSGGPVVDTKGRLVGVAVATIRDGQGIGFAVPSRELDRIMQGRIGRVRVTSRKGTEGGVIVRVEAELLDPTNNLRSPAVHYFHVPPKSKQPDTTALDKQPGSKKLELKIEKGLAVVEFNVAAPEGAVLVQVAAEAGIGKPNAISRVRSFSLAPSPKLSDLTGKPLPGWKEFSPRDNTFIVWVPEKPEKQTDEQRDSTLGGQRMRVNTVVGKTTDGLAYQAESVLLPISMAKLARKDLLDIVRAGLLKETGGKLTESKEAASGSLGGAEYIIEAGSTVTRVRVYTSGSRVYTVQVAGTPEEVASADAEIILSSYRVPAPGSTVAAKEPDNPTGKLPTPEPKTVPMPKNPIVGTAPPKGKDPLILGHPSDPTFKDVAPANGYLIGLELGLGKFGANDVIYAVRPIYKVGDKEVLGEQRGTNLTRVMVVKAKEGYAVGALTLKAGLGLDGLSLTFMKLVDGKLAPNDSYESDWIGGPGGRAPVKFGGDGTPVIGLIGRTNARDANGLGILLKGQEEFDPTPKKK